MIEIEHFTDPACPFAFSAEPVRLRLRWHYGDGIRWTTRMIMLTREEGEGEKLAGGAAGLQREYGMPIDPDPHARAFSTEAASLAVVATRLNAPDRLDALLRRLRVRIMVGGLPDEPETIDAAAREAGLEPVALHGWMERAEVAAALEADVAAARSPTAAARALDRKLSGPEEERRYSAPTYLLRRADARSAEACEVTVPGFNHFAVYETAIANLEPELPRRSAPRSIEELLAWAPYPPATAEVTAITGFDETEVRSTLANLAEPIPAGADRYWRLPN